MADESFKVRCVLVNGEADASDPMTEAFKTLDTQGFKPEWYTEANCLEVTQKEKNCAYIFDPFEGEAFSYISSLGCRILGPQCILTALHYKMEIPRKRIPVYNLAMKNVVVSCTSMERQERDQIYHQVELMGGMGSKDFTEEVTHLIAKEVGSRKYEVAISLGKQVMLPQWVQAVWNIAKLRHIHATDGQFEKYKCQIFLGLVICVSGLDTKERKEVKKLVEQEGGKYSGEMKLNHCTHLIINEPQGQKYEFAKRWNLMIVRSEWIYDCIEKGHYIKETDYIVNNNRGSGSLQTSTPEKEHGQGGVSCLADISSISNISMAHISHVNDTAIQNNTTRQSVIAVDPIVLLDVTQAPAGLYLDGCKIFLSGFQGTALEKVRKLINTGGGTRFNSINESVTHVVMSDSTEKSISALKLGNFRPHVVTSSWLVECFRKGHTVDEDLYRSVELPPLESCSPKIKSKRKSEVISKPKQPLITEPVTEPPQEEMNDIMSQYLPQPDQGITHSGDTTVVEQLPSHIDFDEDMTQEPDDKCQDNIEENGIFGKKTFMFFGFEEEAVKTLTEYINEVGGKVLSGHSRTVPNYGIVPIDGFQVERTVQEVVTNAWLQMCIEQETVLDVASNELFTPVEIVGGAMPLTACVISISGYSGAERDCLMHIAEILGAMCQEFLVRNRNKGFEPNTHLIVKQPEGSKYAAAKKWGLFIVSKSWLFACAKVGEKLCESKYPVVASTDELEAQGNMDIQTEPQNRKQNNKVPIIQGPTPSTSAETRTNSNHGPMEVEITKTEEKSVPCVKGSRHSSHGAMEVDNGQTEEKSEPSKEIKMLTPNPAQNEMKQKVLKHTDSKEILQLAGVNSSIGVKELPKNNKISGDSQKENKSIKKRASHPVSVDEKTDQTHPLNHNRVTELQNEDMTTPKTLTSNKRLSLNSPALEPFDLTSCMQALESPAAPSHRKTNRRKSSLPLDELFIKQVDEALKTISSEEPSTTVGHETESKQMDIALGKSQPLAGVIIAVGKKLSLQQAELNDIVADLGGDYKWTYDNACTHFVFQGKTNDISKEFRLARQQMKIIVSPFWIHACKEQEMRVEESLYPHNYNPNLALNISTPARTPGRYSRKTRLGNKSQTNTGTENKELQTNFQSKKTDPTKQMNFEVTSDGESKTKTAEKKELDAEDHKKESVQEKVPMKKDNTHLGPEPTGTLEITEIMTKELENIMNSSKPKKQRRSKKHNNSGQLETSGTSAVDSSEVEAEKRLTKQADRESNSVPEPSQSLQVTWDDPTGRLEQEKLAHKLERAFSPTQEVDTMTGMGFEEDAQFSDEEQIQLPDLPENIHSNPPPAELEERTPTPDAPKLAFPMPKKPREQLSPEPVNIVEEAHPQIKDKNVSYVFILSGMSQEERDDYGALVEQLGGKMLELQNYDPQCTHLVVGTPARNEKFLASVAAGKWVLHKSYFEACRQEKGFVKEDFYEWGGDGTESLLQTLSPQVVRLAGAAYRWRRKIQQEKKKNPKCLGAFGGWDVVLCTDRNKEGNFRRLLVAGGANVLPIKPPFNKSVSATHAFLEPNKMPVTQEDIECLLSSDVLCLRPDFIAAHLTDNPVPKDYHPPEVSSIMKRSSKASTTTSKRKSGLSSSNTSQNKRSKKC